MRGSAGSGSSAANSIAVEPEPARHDRRARALEDAELRVAVRLERAVAVEMVGLEVEQDGDVARERRARPRAESSRARRRPCVPGLDLQRDVRQGAPDVAGDLDLPAGGAEDRRRGARSSSSCRSCPSTPTAGCRAGAGSRARPRSTRGSRAHAPPRRAATPPGHRGSSRRARHRPAGTPPPIRDELRRPRRRAFPRRQPADRSAATTSTPRRTSAAAAARPERPSPSTSARPGSQSGVSVGTCPAHGERFPPRGA